MLGGEKDGSGGWRGEGSAPKVRWHVCSNRQAFAKWIRRHTTFLIYPEVQLRAHAELASAHVSRGALRAGTELHSVELGARVRLYATPSPTLVRDGLPGMNLVLDVAAAVSRNSSGENVAFHRSMFLWEAEPPLRGGNGIGARGETVSDIRERAARQGFPSYTLCPSSA